MSINTMVIITFSFLFLGIIFVCIMNIKEDHTNSKIRENKEIESTKLYNSLIESKKYTIIYHKNRDDKFPYIYVKYKESFLEIRVSRSRLNFNYLKFDINDLYAYNHYSGFDVDCGVKVKELYLAKKMVLLHDFWIKNNNGNDFYIG